MTSARADRLVPAGLILLAAVPVLASGLRLAELAGASGVVPAEARFTAAPLPVAVHVAAASAFSVLGAFQFAAGPRRRPWHRRAGLLLLPLGAATALSALWMTAFYPSPPRDGDLLTLFRYGFGAAMLLALVLGAIALRRRDFRAHGAWLTRAYAIAAGAGTQAVLLGGAEAAPGEPGVLARALLHAAAWLLNLVVAEWFIRRRHRTTLEEDHRDHRARRGPDRLRTPGPGPGTRGDRAARAR